MKPRIRIRKDGIWYCEGGGRLGFAITPELAYASWNSKSRYADWVSSGIRVTIADPQEDISALRRLLRLFF